MSVSPEEIEQRMDRFETGLRKADMKMTIQRMEIFREVAGSADHPDVETIFKRLRMRLPTVSLDTVYRTLWMLLDLGLLSTLGASRDRTRFDANMKTHHHFVCVQCGMTRDFYSEELDRLKVPGSVALFGSMEKTRVEVSGLCKQCSTESNPKTQKEDVS
ncbi:MAG: transcriptional repressor [Desulfatibacillum sp.]|nr:transcriptional repressor [Desulfatibacillum sp.]